MNTSVQAISIAALLWAFVPVAVVIAILFGWAVMARTSVYAIARMLLQLLLVGYVLTYIFDADRALIIALVLAVMLIAASWIAIRPVRQRRPRVYSHALTAIAIGGGLTLIVVTQQVLDLDPWYLPHYVVPLAGMIFASSMNSVSLAAERFESETDGGRPAIEARGVAMQAALIPVVNSLFAVGLVSLPGMMTGQILSGVSPFVAAKYQIVVMCMIFGASGVSAALYLVFAANAHARKGA